MAEGFFFFNLTLSVALLLRKKITFTEKNGQNFACPVLWVFRNPHPGERGTFHSRRFTFTAAVSLVKVLSAMIFYNLWLYSKITQFSLCKMSRIPPSHVYKKSSNNNRVIGNLTKVFSDRQILQFWFQIGEMKFSIFFHKFSRNETF